MDWDTIVPFPKISVSLSQSWKDVILSLPYSQVIGIRLLKELVRGTLTRFIRRHILVVSGLKVRNEVVHQPDNTSSL